ncbi:MAG: V-type ATP synthase subunit I [Methanomassiliicoccales archaeon]|nr:MAG: V-type ATP synthase subunit I [Methanomassiliicoccales archaeon]
MLIPEEMSRIIIVGSKESMKKTIEVLYKSESIHVIDFPADEQGFSLGSPLPESSEASKKLLKLRALEKDLGLTNGPVKGTVPVSKIKAELEMSMEELDKELGAVIEAKAKAAARLNELQIEKKSLEPFVKIELPLELYKGYYTIGVIAGHVNGDPTSDIKKVSPDAEVFASKDGKNFAIFYPLKDANAVQDILVKKGFVEVQIPSGKGMPSDRVKEIDEEILKLQASLEESTKKLDEIREKFGLTVAAADEQLSIEVQVAETPLRFGTTPHAFIIDGWVPTADVDKLRRALEEGVGDKVFLDVLETAKRFEGHAHDTGHIQLIDYGKKDETPSKQSNNRTVKKFEFLTEMISTPKYNEIDPSFVLAITFPLFFGLMVGDVGYGIAFASLGALGLKKCRSPEWRTIATMLFFGGIWAIIIGYFMFGEALGMHFEPMGDELTWSTLLHTNIDMPFISEPFSKLHDVKILLFISLMIGFAHLAMGFGIGFYNKTIRYGLKHAVMEKFSWLLILIGGWFLLIYIIDMLVAPLDSWGFPLLDMYLYISLAMIIPGVVMAYLGEGGGALLELPGLMSNVMSYTRLTAIGMSKAGLAFAFNTLAFEIIIDVTKEVDIVFAIVALAVFIVGQLMVFILGIISAGMHSIRLHYVELFQKFYEGGGVKFDPLRIVRKITTEKAGE